MANCITLEAELIKSVLSAAALVVFGATSGLAGQVTCEFTSWKGGSKEVAQSWIGTGFGVRKEKSGAKVARFFGKKSTDWTDVRVKSASNFTTYIFRQTSSAAAGHVVNNRFSFRVYESGKCQGYVEANGFRPIIAKGKVK